MITKRKLDAMQVRAKLKITKLHEDWKLKFESGPWREVESMVEPKVEVNNARNNNSQQG
jgi:hypothetical protein